MKRIALTLAILLCGAVAGAQAGGPHHGYHGQYGGHGGYHHGYGYRYRAPVVVARPSIVVAPPLVVPACRHYGYRYYDPAPAYGFYYEGRGLSIGVGF